MLNFLPACQSLKRFRLSSSACPGWLCRCDKHQLPLRLPPRQGPAGVDTLSKSLLGCHLPATGHLSSYRRFWYRSHRSSSCNRHTPSRLSDRQSEQRRWSYTRQCQKTQTTDLFRLSGGQRCYHTRRYSERHSRFRPRRQKPCPPSQSAIRYYSSA